MFLGEQAKLADGWMSGHTCIFFQPTPVLPQPPAFEKMMLLYEVLYEACPQVMIRKLQRFCIFFHCLSYHIKHDIVYNVELYKPCGYDVKINYRYTWALRPHTK